MSTSSPSDVSVRKDEVLKEIEQLKGLINAEDEGTISNFINYLGNNSFKYPSLADCSDKHDTMLTEDINQVFSLLKEKFPEPNDEFCEIARIIGRMVFIKVRNNRICGTKKG